MDKVIDTKNAIANLMKAVDAVQKGSNLPTAAQKFNIPVSILFNRISSVRRNKNMNSPPGTSKDMPAKMNATPDRYGMVINEKLYRHRRKKVHANDLTVYVSEKVFQAIHKIKSGIPILEVANKYNIDKRVLLKKLGEISRYRASIVSKNKKKVDANKRKLALFGNCNSSSFHQNSMYPYLSAKDSVKPMIRRMSRVYSLDFPEDVINCINELEEKIVSCEETVLIISYEEAVLKYGFKLVHLGTIIRNLKQSKRKRVKFGFVHAEKIYNALKHMIPSYSGSPPIFNEDLLPKTCSKGLLKNDLLVKCVWALNGGMTITEAVKKFGILSQDLQNAFRILGIRKNQAKPGFVWRRRSGTLSEAELTQILDEKISKKPMIKASSNTRIVKKGSSKMPMCLFCHQLGNRDVELGKLHVINKIAVHYYCLLFSSALEQNGNDNEGVLGFLPKDILKEITRGNKLKCHYCGEKGATIGCNNKYCKKTYHFPCGLDNYAQYIFTDNFSSMCVKHRHFQDGTNKGEKVECPICKEDMIADPKFAVWSPCCQKSSWFHKICLQKMALSAGYFFKCPLCNDKNTFVPEMLRLGIFVPEQDASWELEPNAFQELLERPILCDAVKCRCPSGRKSDEEGTKWEVILCHLCGSSGIHIACGKLQSNSSEWNCVVCSEMLQESALRTKLENRIRRAKGRRKRNQILSDEDDSSVEGTPKKDCLYRSLTEDSPSSSSLEGRNHSFSSSLFEGNYETEVFVPEGIQGDVIISKLRQAGSPLSDALKEMEAYAEQFPNKLSKSRFSVEMFLELLNGYLEIGDEDSHKPLVSYEHLRKFSECQLNYDQMRLLRKSFEMCFAIQILKMKILQSQRQARENPFNGRKYGTSQGSRNKKVNGLKKSLANLLSKAREANLLRENNTWTEYYESLEEKPPKISASEEFPEPSTSKPSSSVDDEPSSSYRYDTIKVPGHGKPLLTSPGGGALKACFVKLPTCSEGAMDSTSRWLSSNEETPKSVEDNRCFSSRKSPRLSKRCLQPHTVNSGRVFNDVEVAIIDVAEKQFLKKLHSEGMMVERSEKENCGGGQPPRPRADSLSCSSSCPEGRNSALAGGVQGSAKKCSPLQTSHLQNEIILDSSPSSTRSTSVSPEKATLTNNSKPKEQQATQPRFSRSLFATSVPRLNFFGAEPNVASATRVFEPPLKRRRKKKIATDSYQPTISSFFQIQPKRG